MPLKMDEIACRFGTWTLPLRIQYNLTSALSWSVTQNAKNVECAFIRIVIVWLFSVHWFQSIIQIILSREKRLFCIQPYFYCQLNRSIVFRSNANPFWYWGDMFPCHVHRMHKNGCSQWCVWGRTRARRKKDAADIAPCTCIFVKIRIYWCHYLFIDETLVDVRRVLKRVCMCALWHTGVAC